MTNALRLALWLAGDIRSWPAAVRSGARIARICLGSPGSLKPSIRTLLISSELIIQAVPMLFTICDRPALTAEGINNMLEGERFLRQLSKRLSIPQGPDIVKCVEEELTGRPVLQAGFLHNAVYVAVVAFLGSHLRDMFNYSKQGLEAMAAYGDDDVNELTAALPLLLPTTRIESEDVPLLAAMLQREDAFRNYFAMVVLIVHAEHQLPVVMSILLSMLDAYENAGQLTYAESHRLNLLKGFRQAISIFSFIFRRIEKNEGLAGEAADFIVDLLGRLQRAVQGDSNLMRLFLKPSIFDQGDPFNPLLPLGIYCSGRLVPPDREWIFSETFSTWLSLAQNLKGNAGERNAMFERVVYELVPLGYFSPEFAMERAVDVWQLAKTFEQRSAVGGVMSILAQLAPGTIERVLISLGRGADLDAMTKAMRGRRIGAENLKRMYRAMRVFAWHECITTVMVNHTGLSQAVINGFERAFTPGATVYQVTTGVIETIAEHLYSPEIDGDFYKLFNIEKNE